MSGTHDMTRTSTWSTLTKVGHNALISLVSSAIVQRIPNATVVRNQIPKAYLPYDIYCNLIPNSDPNLPFFQQVPRTGTFEVSYKGLVSIFTADLRLNFIYYS